MQKLADDAAPGSTVVTMRSRPAPGVPASVVLVCDACDRELAAAVHLRDWYVLWPVAVEAGWRGEPHPFGVHRCADCAVVR